LAVAGSLAARDGFPLRKSVMVWCAYMLAAEAGSRDLPRAFVDYDALLEDWRPQVAAAEARLGEPLPALTPAAGRKIDAFLSTELRRNSGEGDLLALGEAGAMAAGVLDWLRAAARGAEPDRAPLDRAAAWLAAQKALYGDLVSPVSADRSLARTALADAEGRAAFLERTLEETRREAELRAAFLEQTLEETREIVATLEARIQSLYGTIGEMKDHVDSLTRTCKDLRRHARSLETQLKASQATVREAAGRLESLVEPG
jgi:hypothetical protein